MRITWATPLALGLGAISLLPLASANNNRTYRFAVVAKDLENVFFQDVGRGCHRRAEELTHQSLFDDDESAMWFNCVFVGSPTGDKRYRQGNQTEIVEDLLENGQLDGMAIAVIDADEGKRLIQKALSKGIPTITYNVDSPDSGRMAYVGADNEAFGRELANTLLQSKPGGGKYVIVDRDSAVIKRIAAGVRKRLTEEGSWSEAEEAGSPLNCLGKGDVAQDLIYQAMQREPGIEAVISAGSYPVRDEFVVGWRKLVKDPRFQNVKFIVATERDSAIALFKEGYIHNLVGIQPYAHGVKSINRLHQLSLAHQGNNLLGAPLENENTHEYVPLISLLSVDAYLQRPTVDMNYIGPLVIFGYVSFGVIAFLGIVLFGITHKYRDKRVIKASQPFFLQMIIIGTLFCSATIIPLGIDHENYSIDACSTACKIAPWLFVIGFNLIVSALYAKTRRINIVMKSARKFKKVAVTEKDVLKPFALKMFVSAVVLLCWTFIEPAVYTINPTSGTDNWNRSYKSFYGTCYEGSQVLPYIIPLITIMAGTIIVSMIEAYKARNIQTEYQESIYIAMVMAVKLQGFVMGVPLLALLEENPSAQYFVLVFVIFMVQLATLLLIFLPKLIKLRASLGDSERDSTESSSKSMRDLLGGVGLKFYKYELKEAGGARATVPVMRRATNALSERHPDGHQSLTM